MNPVENELLHLVTDKDYKVEIRNAGKFRFPPNYRFASHTHAEMEINYITSGSCIIEVENEIIPLKKGDCIVIHPYQKHKFMVNISKSCSISQLEYCVTLPAKVIRYAVCLTCDKEFYVVNNCQNLCEILENICRYYRSEEEDDYINTQLDLSLLQMYSILSKHIQLLPGRKIINTGKMGELVNVIKRRLDSDINIEELAQEFQVSSRYIRKVFASEAGMSCVEYITMLRIAKAKELLWNGTIPITEIGILCGFNSTQYFCRIFKRQTDMTPVEYRNIWKGTTAVVNEVENTC